MSRRLAHEDDAKGDEADLLEPMLVIADAGGPMNTMPFCASSSANAAFSLRKPYLPHVYISRPSRRDAGARVPRVDGLRDISYESEPGMRAGRGSGRACAPLCLQTSRILSMRSCNAPLSQYACCSLREHETHVTFRGRCWADAVRLVRLW
jgi:hypothetical protein